MLYRKKISNTPIQALCTSLLILLIVTSCDITGTIPPHYSNSTNENETIESITELYPAIGYEPTTSTLTGKNISIAMMEPRAKYVIGDDIQYGEFNNQALHAFGNISHPFIFLKNIKNSNNKPHATLVASVIASSKIGIARGVSLYPISFQSSNLTGPTPLYIATIYSKIKHHNFLAINNSWGDGAYLTSKIQNDEEYWEKEWKTKSVSSTEHRQKNSTYTQLLAFASEMEINKSNAPLWVWAAGNKYYNTGSAGLSVSQPHDVRYTAGLPHYIKSLEKYWIAVSGVRHDGSYTYHIPCTKMQSWCLAAPAKNVVTLAAGKRLIRNGGTSFAAPQVTGALALLKEKCPASSQFEIRDMLLRTARHETAQGYRLKAKDGTYAKTTRVAVTTADGTPEMRDLSYEYGHGIMRLDLALKEPCS